MVSVLICDKLLVVRNGLRALLEREPGVEVVDTTDSGAQAIALARRVRPDVVVAGLELVGLSGVDLIR